MLRRLFLIVLLLLALTVSTSASDNVTYASFAVSTTAVAIPAAVLDNGRGAATACWVRVETNDVRYRFDGTAPTASEGMLFKSTDPMLAIDDPRNAKRLRFIRVSADATVFVTCWH